MTPSDAASVGARPLVSIVIIGRNEGARLTRCLKAIGAMQPCSFDLETIYVDSDSHDNSLERAAALGARVIGNHSAHPSAARGRNTGWRAAQGEFVLFLDGDTELHPDFISRALDTLADPGVAVVWGHRRESRPGQSLYVRVLDLDWIYPPGPSDFCGGDALMRRAVLDQSGGFDAALIAGEEPELCRRIRALGYRIEHIDAPMTRHDLAITSLGAYWRRAFRAGHAYAALSTRTARSADPLWLAEARRNLLHGTALMLAPGLAWLAADRPWQLAALACLAILVLARTMHRCRWKTPQRSTRLLYAMHSHLQQVPILCGQVAFHLDAWRGKRRRLIEY